MSKRTLVITQKYSQYPNEKFVECEGVERVEVMEKRFLTLSMLISGFCISCIRSYPTFASNCLKGSALGDGIDWIIRNSVSVSATSVSRILPSSACNFKRTIYSYTSLPSLVRFFFRSLQYRLGILLPDSISITSITEKYQVSVYSSQWVRTFLLSNNLMLLIALGAIYD